MAGGHGKPRARLVQQQADGRRSKLAGSPRGGSARSPAQHVVAAAAQVEPLKVVAQSHAHDGPVQQQDAARAGKEGGGGGARGCAACSSGRHERRRRRVPVHGSGPPPLPGASRTVNEPGRSQARESGDAAREADGGGGWTALCSYHRPAHLPRNVGHRQARAIALPSLMSATCSRVSARGAHSAADYLSKECKRGQVVAKTQRPRSGCAARQAKIINETPTIRSLCTRKNKLPSLSRVDPQPTMTRRAQPRTGNTN